MQIDVSLAQQRPHSRSQVLFSRNILFTKGKEKVNSALGQAMKAQRRNRI